MSALREIDRRLQRLRIEELIREAQSLLRRAYCRALDDKEPRMFGTGRGDVFFSDGRLV